jgi:hypothetical protein
VAGRAVEEGVDGLVEVGELPERGFGVAVPDASAGFFFVSPGLLSGLSVIGVNSSAIPSSLQQVIAHNRIACKRKYARLAVNQLLVRLFTTLQRERHHAPGFAVRQATGRDAAVRDAAIIYLIQQE